MKFSDSVAQASALGHWRPGALLLHDARLLQGGRSTTSATCREYDLIHPQAHGAIIVCDSSRLATLEVGAERWRQDIAAKLDKPPIPVVLAVNKVRLHVSAISRRCSVRPIRQVSETHCVISAILRLGTTSLTRTSRSGKRAMRWTRSSAALQRIILVRRYVNGFNTFCAYSTRILHSIIF